MNIVVNALLSSLYSVVLLILHTVVVITMCKLIGTNIHQFVVIYFCSIYFTAFLHKYYYLKGLSNE